MDTLEIEHQIDYESKQRKQALKYYSDSKKWIKFKNIQPTKVNVKDLVNLFKSIPKHIECCYTIKPSQRHKITLNDWNRHDKVVSVKETLTPRRIKGQEEAGLLYVGSSLSPFKRLIQHFTSHTIKADNTLGVQHDGSCLRLGEWCKTPVDITIYQLPGVGKDAIQFIERQIKQRRSYSTGRKEN